MSHNIPDKVLHRASKDVYRTRFLMQNDTPKKTHNKSELIALMGGTPVLDLLAIALCERIRRNIILDPVYGGISLKSLIPLQTELLSYALADTYPATVGTGIWSSAWTPTSGNALATQNVKIIIRNKGQQ
eukprot:scaffold25638_cov127-Cylindrotheca_fusiformis.AAC.1